MDEIKKKKRFELLNADFLKIYSIKKEPKK
jgi:hypothetical protein